MKYFIKRLPSGVASIGYDELEDHDFVVDELPEYSGILMVDENGNLYDSLQPGFNSEPTDHEILMTLLGVTE